MNALERRVLTLPLRPVKLSLRKRSKKREEDDDKKEDDKPKEADSEGGETDEKDDQEDDEKEESEDDEEDKGERESDGPGVIEGYAAVFHAENEPGTEYELWSDPTMRAVERIARGAFSRAIKDEDDCRACFNHDANMLLGRTSAGTCRLEEDERGLRYDVDLPDTTLGRDVAELVSRGDVTGSSFGFVVEQESWRESEEENGRRVAVRTIESVRLLDVGPVTYPAYAGTSAASAGRSTAPVRALGGTEEARSSYQRWKDGQATLPAKLASIRARAVEVGMASR